MSYLMSLCEASGRKVVGVLAPPPNDGPAWWADGVHPEVWKLARFFGLRILRESELRDLEYDLLISVYWHRTFELSALKHTPLNLNLHTAPLPAYRGRYSCSMAILNGDKEFGATLHIMTARVDCGPIVDTVRFPITPYDTARTLYDRANGVGAAMLYRWIPSALAGRLLVTPQDVVAVRDREPPRSYGRDALDQFRERPHAPLTTLELDRRRRALTFPPRFLPPAWVIDACANSDHGSVSV